MIINTLNTFTLGEFQNEIMSVKQSYQKHSMYLDFVWFNELCVGVDIVDILVSQCHPVAPVQWANVVVHRCLHGFPVVFHCVQTDGHQCNDKVLRGFLLHLSLPGSVLCLSLYLSHQTPSQTCVHPAWLCPAGPSGASASSGCSPHSHMFHQVLITTVDSNNNHVSFSTTWLTQKDFSKKKKKASIIPQVVPFGVGTT